MSHVELEDNLFSVGESDDIDNDKVRLYGATSVGTRLVVPMRRPMTSPDTTSSITSLQVSSSSQQCVGASDGEFRLLTDDMSAPSSRSSQDFEPGIITRTYDYENNCWNHPKVRDNCSVVLASVMLTVLGAGLMITGVVIELLRSVTQDYAVHGYVFLIAGIICLIPGLYHSIYIYCAVKGAPGFSFNNMPMLK